MKKTATDSITKPKPLKTIKRIVKLENVKKRAIKISEKTIETTGFLAGFFEELATFFLFIRKIARSTFSRDFEFKEFARQCFQIGYKTLPLISITGTIMAWCLPFNPGRPW